MNETPQSLEPFRDFNVLELPIGIYQVDVEGNFIVCNQTLRKMLRLPLNGDVKASTLDFYADKKQREVLVKQALENDLQGKYLERVPIHFKVNGQDLYVEDYCKPLKDRKTGDVIGFVGCLVDITDEQKIKIHEKELRKRVEELTFDIGKILHANNTTLVMTTHTLDATIQTLEPNPFKDTSAPAMEDVDEVLTEHVNALASVLEKFIQVATEERRLSALSEYKWEFLKEQMEGLREFKERIPVPESRPATLRTVAYSINQTCQIIKPGYLPREAIRELLQSANQLERVTTLISALNNRMALLQMEYTLQSLREYITSDVRETAKQSKLKIANLIDQCVNRLAEYAQSARVKIDIRNIADVEIVANEREIIRALSNLLHNAIKYTWSRDKTKEPWVAVEAKVYAGNVYFEFENWGVPISKDEIEKELLFQLGYRGRLSTDRGRLGTGIGLTDARHVARTYGGDIQLESRPTRSFKEDTPDYYKQPFITKVTLFLPLA